MVRVNILHVSGLIENNGVSSNNTLLMLICWLLFVSNIGCFGVFFAVAVVWDQHFTIWSLCASGCVLVWVVMKHFFGHKLTEVPPAVA